MLAGLIPEIRKITHRGHLRLCAVVPVMSVCLTYFVYLSLIVALALIGVYTPMTDILATIPDMGLIVALIVGIVSAFVLAAWPRYFVAFKINAIDEYDRALIDEREAEPSKIKFSKNYGIFAFIMAVAGATAVLGVLYVYSIWAGVVFDNLLLIGVIEAIAAPIVAFAFDKGFLHDIADGTKTFKEKLTEVKAEYAEFRATIDKANDEVSKEEAEPQATPAAPAELTAIVAAAVAAAMASQPKQ